MKIYNYFEKTKTNTTTSTPLNCRTSTRFPRGRRVLIISRCVPGTNRDWVCWPRWKAATCSGRFRLWGWTRRKNAVPKQAALSIMPSAHSGQFLLRSRLRGKTAGAVWCSGPGKRRGAKTAVEEHKNTTHAPQPPASFLLKHKDYTLLLCLQPKLKCLNEGEPPLPLGCWWRRQAATLPLGLPRDPSPGLGVTWPRVHSSARSCIWTSPAEPHAEIR